MALGSVASRLQFSLRKAATCQDNWSKLGEPPRSPSEQHRNQLARTSETPGSLCFPAKQGLDPARKFRISYSTAAFAHSNSRKEKRVMVRNPNSVPSRTGWRVI